MAKDRLFIEPKTTVISNPAVNYGVASGTKKWTGFVLSFERRVRFGKEMPSPWWKPYTVRATSEEAARQMMGTMAMRDGYALGGVQHVTEVK